GGELPAAQRPGRRATLRRQRQRLLFPINLALLVAIRLRQEGRLRKRGLPAWNRMQAGAHSLAIPVSVAVAGPLDPPQPAGDTHSDSEPIAERDRRTRRHALIPPPLATHLPPPQGEATVGASRMGPMAKKAAVKTPARNKAKSTSPVAGGARGGGCLR